VAGTSVGHPAQPPAQAGSPRAGCTGSCPGRSGISPEKETLQPLWAAWARDMFADNPKKPGFCSYFQTLARGPENNRTIQAQGWGSVGMDYNKP